MAKLSNEQIAGALRDAVSDWSVPTIYSQYLMAAANRLTNPLDPKSLSDGELIQCLEEMRSRDRGAPAMLTADKQPEAK